MIGTPVKKPISIIGFYSFYSFSSDVLINKYFLNHFGSELIAYRLFTIIEFSTLIIFLYKSTQKPVYKKSIIYLIPIFLLSIILDISSYSFNEFDSLPTGIESLILISITILILKENLNNIDALNKASTWIFFGFIVYFSGSLFLFVLSQKNIHNSEFSDLYAIITATLNILKNIIFCIAIIIEKNSRKQTLNLNSCIT